MRTGKKKVVRQGRRGDAARIAAGLLAPVQAADMHAPARACTPRVCTPRVKPARLLASTILAGLSLSGAPTAYANPVDGVVVAGSASISSSGAKLDVVQASDRAVIDWRGFDIGAGEHTQFTQPSSSSIALNRVNSNAPSKIDGRLSANGQVVVVNQSGILFGKSAQVDVSGLIATTADIDNDKFMTGGTLSFDKPGKANAAIVNEGSITAREAGLVGLVAPNVVNSGVITAKLGKVHLASGDTATVDLYGDKLLEVAVSDQVTSQLIANTGVIQADGGSIAITAAAGAQVVNSLVSVSGTLQAQSVAEKNGKIEIIAYGSNAVKDNTASAKGTKSGSSTVLISATLDASGRKAGERGGSITVTGDNVALLSGTIIDASGHTGLSGTTTGKLKSDKRTGSAGGEILIGGDYLGQGTTATAKNLYVSSGALILNDSLNAGDAGRSIFWSDNDTSFYGNVYARALGGKAVNSLTWDATTGGNTGDGGFVETSGHAHLNAGGYVNLTSSNGARGTYFLDPTDITIYGNVDPSFVSTDSSINLAASLKLWLDAADTSKVQLTYSADSLSSATASGTMGNNTITTSLDVSSSLAIGARIRLGAAGSITTADTLGADTYTITNISGTTITLSSNLTTNYSGSNLYRGLVSNLGDKSGQANDAAQLTEANMPLWVSNGQNGLGTIKFDGNQFLNSGLYQSVVGNDATFNVTVNELSQASAPGVVFWRGNASGLNQAFSDGTKWGYHWDNQNYGWTGGPSITLGATQIISLHITPTQASISANGDVAGVNVASHNSVNDSSTLLSIGQDPCCGGRNFIGNIQDIAIYNSDLSTNAQVLTDQYAAAKWGIALTPSGTGVTEAEKAMASDGYSVFTTRYLERLSQSADISLQASNSINLDFKGDTLNLANGRSFTLTTTNGNISNASAGSIVTTNGDITMTAGGAGAINLSGFNLTANGTGVVNVGGWDVTINASNIAALNSDINISALHDILSGGNYLLQTSGTGNINLTAGHDINFTHDLDLEALGSGDITLRANNSILYSGGGDITTNGGNITLNSDRDASGEGAISLGNSTELRSNGGDITLGGGSNPANGYAYATVSNAAGIMTTAGTLIDTGGGNLSMRGKVPVTVSGGIGLSLSGNFISGVGNVLAEGISLGANIGSFILGVIQSTTGNIVLNGESSSSPGIYINGYVGGNVFSHDGDITLNGTSASDQGILILGNNAGSGKVQITGAGNITLNGTGDFGLYMPNDAQVINKTGTLTINAGTNRGIFAEPNTKLGDSSTTGDIIINTDRIIHPFSSIAPFSIIQTTGNVFFRPVSASTTIGINGSAGGLQISSDMLNAITAANVTIGRADGSGLIRIAGLDLSVSNYNLNFLNGAGNIQFDGGTTALTLAANKHLTATTTSGDITTSADGRITASGTGYITLSSGNDINLSNDFDLTTATGAVTLQANNSIFYSGGAGITTNGGNIILNSDRDASGAGAIKLAYATELKSNGGDITLGGGSNPVSGYAYATASNAFGIETNFGTLIDSGGGNISLRGTAPVAVSGGRGIHLEGNILSGAGDITIEGVGSATSNAAVATTRASIQSTSGNISITGTAPNGVSVVIGGFSDSTISSADGDITITGNGNPLNYTFGLYIVSDANNNNQNKIYSTGNGNISLNGEGYHGIVLQGKYFIANKTGTLSFNSSGSRIIGDVADFGDSSTTGDIVFNVNGFANPQLGSVRTTGNVIFKTFDDTKTIGVNGSAGDLQITKALLDTITATNVIIGRADGSGLMRITGADLSARNYNLNFVNGSGGIQFDGGGTALTLGADKYLTATTVSGDIASSGNGGIAISGAGYITLASGNDISFAHDFDLTTASGDVALRANNSILYSGGGDITTNSGNITLNSDRDASGAGAISLGSGTVITSNGSNITLGGGANPLATAAAGTATYNSGIELNGAKLSTATGAISLRGKGHDDNSLNNQHGIYLHNSAIIESTGSGAGLGAITLHGTSGDGAGNDYGVYLSGASTNITSGYGNINITGTGYSTDSSQFASGVALNSSTISSTGMGANAATITLTGTGSANAIYGSGVVLDGNANVESINGDILLTGTAPGAGGAGIYTPSGTIVSTGAGADAATISIYTTTVGSFVSGVSSYDGDVLFQSSCCNSQIGSITTTGLANITINDPGYIVVTNSVLGGAAAKGNITLNTNGIVGTPSLIQTTGNVFLRPYSANYAVGFNDGAGGFQITQAMMDAINAPTVTIGRSDSTGLLTTGAYNWNSTLTNLNLLGGDIAVNGNITSGSGSGTQDKYLTLKANNDIVVNANRVISSSSTYGKLHTVLNSDADASLAGAIFMDSGSVINSNGGNITLGGGANPLTTAAYGNAVYASGIELYGATLSTTTGAITLNGQGDNNTANSNQFGIYVHNGSVIESTGSGSGLGSITLNGTGGDGAGGDYGIYLTDANTRITSGYGNISITGTGQSTNYVPGEAGIMIEDGVSIASTGLGADAATITLTGQGSTNTFYGGGIYFRNGSSIVSTDGDITLAGTNRGNAGPGIEMDNASITSAGTGSNAAMITLTAISGSGQSRINGVTSHKGNIFVSADYGQTYIGDIISLGSADIMLQSAAGAFYGTGGVLGGASNTGNIVISTNDLTSYQGNFLPASIQTTGAVTVAPASASATIGFSGAAGMLQISQAFMDAINAPTVTIGRSDSTGLITTGNYNWNATLTNLNLLGGNITVDGNITSGSGSGSQDKTLTLKANNDIVVNANKVISSSSTYGKLHTILNSDADANQAGAIVMNSGSGILSNGGSITLGGGNSVLSAGSGYAVGTASYNNGIQLSASTLDARIGFGNGGNIIINGMGYLGTSNSNNGILTNGAVIRTNGNGSIALNGIGQGTGSSNGNSGISIGLNALVSAVDGYIDVTGTGSNAAGYQNMGVYFSSGSTVTSSGIGNINILGRAGLGAGDGNIGIFTHFGGNVTSTGSGSIMLTGVKGVGTNTLGIQTTAYGSFLAGGASAGGNITLNADTMSLDNFTTQTSGSVIFRPYASSTTIGIAGGAGTLQLTQAILDSITASGITIGRSDSTGAITANGYAWDKDVSFVTGTGGIALAGVQAMGAHRFVAETTGASDITIGASGGVTSSASGNAIVLASGRNVINNAGAGALSAPNGRWLVYSKNASGSTIGGLGGFRRFASSYSGYAPGAVTESGNGFLYADASLGTISITADNISRQYGDANPAFTYSFTCTTGCTQGASITGAPSLGTNATQGSNVGTYAISLNLGSVALTNAYADYELSLTGGSLSITPRALSIAAENKSKGYGASDPGLTYRITNGSLYGADMLSGALSRGAGEAAGNYAIGLGTVSAGTNYTVDYTSALFTILAAPSSHNGNAAPQGFMIPNTVIRTSQLPLAASALPVMSALSIANTTTQPLPIVTDTHGTPIQGIFTGQQNPQSGYEFTPDATSELAPSAGAQPYAILAIDPQLVHDFKLGSVSEF